jgi:hypothetical protein
MCIRYALCFVKGNVNMQMLYDSESFAVVHMTAQTQTAPSSDELPQLARHGFEIVDKRSGKEVYLDGSWAEMFQQHIDAWQLKTPTEEEVEDTLERYAELAQNPVVLH